MFAKYYLLVTVVFACCLNPLHLVHAQDDNQQGFISIDCGLAEGSDYNDPITGIHYQSDAKYIDSGESKSLSGNNPQKIYTTVRSFPQGKKNCYTIPALGKGQKFLIRASFFYGDYDSLNRLPAFDLNLGHETWSKIGFEDSSSVVREEIIHVLSSDYIHVCLVNTDTGTPFISALELMPLSSTNSYTMDSGSLQTSSLVDCGRVTSNVVIRYPDDIYGRIWTILSSTSPKVNTSDIISNGNNYLVPQDVLSTAITTEDVSYTISFSWDTNNPSDQFYIYMHFAQLQDGGCSDFNIYVNEAQRNNKPFVTKYLKLVTYQSQKPETGNARYTVGISTTESSTLPPILNAYEIYKVIKFSNTGTDDSDTSKDTSGPEPSEKKGNKKVLGFIVAGILVVLIIAGVIWKFKLFASIISLLLKLMNSVSILFKNT